jgi:hypothetical protein
MKSLLKVLAFCTLLCAYAAPALAQSSAKTHKFKTTYKVQMYADPDFHSKKLTDIPAGVVMEAIEETERYGGYVKVSYKNKMGWVLKAEPGRYMDVPAPEPACWSNGYKIIGGVYRYFFVLRNDGTLPYTDKITLRLFDREGKAVFEKTVDFSDDPIKPFLIDTQVEAPRFELEHEDGKIEGSTGKLIERL